MKELLSRLPLLGNDWVFDVLAGCSILAVVVVFNRWNFFRRRWDDVDKLSNRLVAKLRDGDLRGADQLLAASPSIEATIVRPALQWIDGGPAATEDAIDAELRKKRRELRRGMVLLGSIRKSAPVVGLLGTIIGIIHTLYFFAEDPKDDAVRNLLVGISQALVAGCAGLVVALVTALACDTLSAKVVAIEDNTGVLGKMLLAHLKSESHLSVQLSTLEEAPDGGTNVTELEGREAMGQRSARLRELD